MDIESIRTEADHATALARVHALWGAPMNSPEGAELEMLVGLIEKYEAEHFLLPNSGPTQAT